MKKALELGGQDHVHEDGSQYESNHQVPSRFVEHLDVSRGPIAVAGRQSDFLDLLNHGLRGGVERKVGRVVGINRHLELAVVAFDPGRAPPSLDRVNITEPNLS